MARIMLLMTVLVSSAFAQAGKEPAYVPFWKTFQAAVTAADRDAVASMTKLPFMLEGQNLNRAQYVAKFDVLFPSSVKRCFQKAKLVSEGTGFQVFCGEQIFLFDKGADGKFRFTEIGVND